MEEIVSLPPMEFFNNDYQAVLDFIEDLGNPMFKIAGDVNLMGKKYITTLGDLVEVGGSLDLFYTKIKSLPDNLKVSGSLDLYNTKITSLPDNLHVGRSLDLRYINITSLPDNLHVGGDLYLSDTPLSEKYSVEEIKKMIEGKGGFVKGNIYI